MVGWDKKERVTKEMLERTAWEWQCDVSRLGEGEFNNIVFMDWTATQKSNSVHSSSQE